MLEFDVIWEALAYKGIDVKLQVHPHPLHDVGARYSGVKRLPMDIVFAVSIELSSVKDETPPFTFKI